MSPLGRTHSAAATIITQVPGFVKRTYSFLSSQVPGTCEVSGTFSVAKRIATAGDDRWSQGVDSVSRGVVTSA